MSEVLVPVIVALITAAGTILVSRIGSSTATRNAMTAPYRELAERVTTLETADEEKSTTIGQLRETIGQLRDHLAVVIRDRDQLVSYVRELAAWMQGGRKPPAPTMPAFLAQHLDPSAFEVAQVAEITTTTTTQRYVVEHAEPEES